MLIIRRLIGVWRSHRQTNHPPTLPPTLPASSTVASTDSEPALGWEISRMRGRVRNSSSSLRRISRRAPPSPPPNKSPLKAKHKHDKANKTDLAKRLRLEKKASRHLPIIPSLLTRPLPAQVKKQNSQGWVSQNLKISWWRTEASSWQHNSSKSISKWSMSRSIGLSIRTIQPNSLAKRTE